MAASSSSELKPVLSRLRSNDSTLTTLNLRSNAIGDSGTRTLATALQHNSTLSSLILSANRISYSGASALAKALQHNSTLTTLYLSDNSIGDLGTSALATALQHNSTLSSLILSANRISYSGASALATALQHNSTLITLKLSRNSIGDSGASAFASALQHNTSLTKLDLKLNLICNSGAIALATALQYNSFLTILNLSNNSISDTAIHSIGDVFPHSSLETLILSNNQITSVPLSFIESRSLKFLDLLRNPLIDPPLEFVSSATIEQIKEYLRAKRSAVTRLKLLVVGYQNTGKTCLVHALIHTPSFESLAQLIDHLDGDRSTHGIAIQAWRACDAPPLNFNVFDFAGQPVYYSSHRNFLAQQQAVYVVVFRADQTNREAEKQVRHWLNLIGSQISKIWRDQFEKGAAMKPIVVVVGTHADLCGPDLHNLHNGWYSRLHSSNEYSPALELHTQVLFINHDQPCCVLALRKLIVEKGKHQLEKTPQGLDIFTNLFPRLDEIRQSIFPHSLFLSTNEFQQMMIECNLTQMRSISKIGVEGLARSLQAMGEVVYLEGLNQICVEPQRLFNMLAEFVQQQKEDSEALQKRSAHKRHVEHETGVVGMATISDVCDRHNGNAGGVVVTAESIVAALEMLDLCVQVRNGEFFFPSLLPEAGDQSQLEQYFRNPTRRFDVQWQLARNSGGKHPSASSSSSTHAEEETSKTEVTPKSLMFGIHVDTIRQLQCEFDKLKFWSNGMYLLRDNTLEVAVVSSAGIERDAVVRLSIREECSGMGDAAELVQIFDILVEIIRKRVRRSVFRSVSEVGVCAHCPRLVEGISGNRPRQTSCSAIHLMHPDSDEAIQPFFVYPLRRMLGHFGEPLPIRLCSTRIREASSSSESLAQSVFSSSLFLQPPGAPSHVCFSHQATLVVTTDSASGGVTFTQPKGIPIDPTNGGPPASQWTKWGAEFCPHSANLRQVLIGILNVREVPEHATRTLLDAIQYLAARNQSVTLDQLSIELQNTKVATCISRSRSIRSWASSAPCSSSDII